MFGCLDWSDAREIARMCRATDVACLIRAKTVPLIRSVDKAGLSDCQRILTLNATGAIMSVSTVEEVKLRVEVSKDWHRGLPFNPFTKETFRRS